VSEVLNRRRQLTLPMIRRLERGLGIPARVLVQEPKAIYRTGRKRSR
jgi:HTH-type transcriptional regulator/antitoxin HigA